MQAPASYLFTYYPNCIWWDWWLGRYPPHLVPLRIVQRLAVQHLQLRARNYLTCLFGAQQNSNHQLESNGSLWKNIVKLDPQLESILERVGINVDIKHHYVTSQSPYKADPLYPSRLWVAFHQNWMCNCGCHPHIDSPTACSKLTTNMMVLQRCFLGKKFGLEPH